MSDNIQFRLNTKTRIFVYVILGVAVCATLFLVLFVDSPEQHQASSNFIASIVALVIGVMLFLIYRIFPAWRNFLEAMPLLILFMASVGLIVPLLVSYHVSIYYFLPVFLIGLNGWLFFTKHIIYGKNNWDEDPTKRVIALTGNPLTCVSCISSSVNWLFRWPPKNRKSGLGLEKIQEPFPV